MAGFAIIGTICINTPQFTPQWIEQSRQHLGIMDIFQRDLCCHDIVSGGVHCQMQLAA